MELLRQVNDVHAHGRPDLFNRGQDENTRPPNSHRSSQTIPARFFVATDTDSTLLGYAFCMDENHAGANDLQPVRTLYIDDICVDERARGQTRGH